LRPPALLFFILAVPLVLGIIPRNWIYGVRTRKALADDRVWYSLNRVGGLILMLASIVYFLVALIWPYHKTTSNNFEIFYIHLAGFTAPLVVVVAAVLFYERRL
jgi:uncharacterized membrane protein